MTGPGHTTYDELPYVGKPFSFTHPDQLATAARFFGLAAPPPDDCRVLELGCGDGGNLIPMAETLPDSRFVGLDLGRRHIEAGHRLISKLELPNVDLQQRDLSDSTDDLGVFDYIICHGVYSWVPPPVQRRILQVCSEQLTETGVALVSYNTLPGWHVRGVVRKMAGGGGPDDAGAMFRVGQARDRLRTALAGIAVQADAYSQLLRFELEKALNAEDHYFFHEYLEANNEAIYHEEFLSRAADYQLQYLSDTELRLMLPARGAPEFEQLLQALAAGKVRRSQTSDFLTNRAFRRTLLCHEKARPREQPHLEDLMSMHVSSSVHVDSDCDVRSSGYATFRTSDGSGFSVNVPLVKAAFVHLSEIAPRAVPVERLLEVARDRLGQAEVQQTTGSEILCHWLLESHATAPTSAVEFLNVPSRFTCEAGDHPCVSPLARIQAAEGLPVVNRCHQEEVVDELHRRVLPLLTGKQSRVALTERLQELRCQGEIRFPSGVESDQALLEYCLANIARARMFV